MHPYREWLNNTAMNVLDTIPRPFGTFEKAKYVLGSGVSGANYYTFITTVHSEPECIEIMKKMYDETYHIEAFFRVSKIQNGKRKTIFTNYPKWVILNE